jgi:cytosine/adenosine deaminase-related metal-dependent hydrolase
VGRRGEEVAAAGLLRAVRHHSLEVGADADLVLVQLRAGIDDPVAGALAVLVVLPSLYVRVYGESV